MRDYVNDPYPLNSSYYWPYGSAGLTPHGRVQMYNLGARVRSLYDGFLDSTYHPEELHASSTYMDRLLMSGEGFLAGLYPPRGWQLWDTSIPWQPTPLYSDSLDNTPIIVNCKRFLQEIYVGVLRYFGDHQNQEYMDGLLDVYSKATGKNITRVDELFYLWDKLIVEETEGYSLPAWTARLYPTPLLQPMSDLFLTAFAGTKTMIRLLIGNFHGELSEVLSRKANGLLSSRRIQYYSGHDSSIIALQVLLGVPQSSVVRVVKAGSSLLLELHEDPTTKLYSVQLLYIDGGSKDLPVTSLPLAGCGEPCALSSLIYNTAKYTKVNFTAECDEDIKFNSTITDSINEHFRHFILKYIE